jgi:selenocysteine-specific elongation factor
MIIATAGHVDHGKTSLVRALTGVDTDRLDEEKRRGLTIDIGFAYADLGGPVPTGFVDVPGHERFVRNMLAGINAIELALLVVAADDGPMPQTREHLAILDVLGAASLVVVLTKIDRTSPAQRELARAAITSLLEPTRFADAPVFEVDTPAGIGLEALRAHLAERSTRWVERETTGGFRMAIDRAFTVPGAGLVVTGAVLSGVACTGDPLVVSPLGNVARVRQIHAQGQPADHARAGQRCAINLSGPHLDRSLIGRGQWLVTPFTHAPAQRIDVTMTALANVDKPIRTGSTVQVHAGAAHVSAHLHLMNQRELAAGAGAFGQLVLEHALPLLWGDRLVIRDPAARATLGGAIVLDPQASARGRSSAQRQTRLQHLRLPDPAQALRALLEASPLGIDLDAFERSRNLTAAAAVQLREASQAHLAMPIGSAAREDIGRPAPGIGLSATHWAQWQATLIDVLSQSHLDHPEHIGLKPAELARSSGQTYLVRFETERDAGVRRADAIAQAALRAVMAKGQIVRDGIHVRRPEHRPVLLPEHQALLERVQAALAQAGLRAPIVGELATALGMDRATLLSFLREMATLGHLLPVAPNRFYLPGTLDELAAIAQKLAGTSTDGSFDAAAYRDASGIGRNLTIEVLEFLDRAGITRFAGNRRMMRT